MAQDCLAVKFSMRFKAAEPRGNHSAAHMGTSLLPCCRLCNKPGSVIHRIHRQLAQLRHVAAVTRRRRFRSIVLSGAPCLHLVENARSVATIKVLLVASVCLDQFGCRAHHISQFPTTDNGRTLECHQNCRIRINPFRSSSALALNSS